MASAAVYGYVSLIFLIYLIQHIKEDIFMPDVSAYTSGIKTVYGQGLNGHEKY